MKSPAPTVLRETWAWMFHNKSHMIRHKYRNKHFMSAMERREKWAGRRHTNILSQMSSPINVFFFIFSVSPPSWKLSRGTFSMAFSLKRSSSRHCSDTICSIVVKNGDTNQSDFYKCPCGIRIEKCCCIIVSKYNNEILVDELERNKREWIFCILLTL